MNIEHITTGTLPTSAFKHLYVTSSNTLTFPKRSEWHCQMFGAGKDFIYTPLEGNEPNWFWRKMQYLCFGNKWIKGKVI